MNERIAFTFESSGKETIDAFRWMPEGEPKGIVQLVHGMAEHMDRYDETAGGFARAGYLVVGHNHLGHGPGAKIKGYFGHKDGWQHMVDDVHILREMTRKEYPGLPYVILGHSMGSFVTRCYITEHSEGLAGCVLSGTGFFERKTVTAGVALANVLCALGQEKKESNFIKGLGFSDYNKAFAPNRTKGDWLTRDEAIVDRYVADPLSGFTFTTGGYRDLFRGLRRLTEEDELKRIEPDLPILFISGAMDPVGEMSEGVKKVAESYRKAGIRDITVNLYPDCRHEILNELNREEVYADVCRWMETHGRK